MIIFCENQEYHLIWWNPFFFNYNYFNSFSILKFEIWIPPCLLYKIHIEKRNHCSILWIYPMNRKNFFRKISSTNKFLVQHRPKRTIYGMGRRSCDRWLDPWSETTGYRYKRKKTPTLRIHRIYCGPNTTIKTFKLFCFIFFFI